MPIHLLDPILRDLLPLHYCEANYLLPIEKNGNKLTIATSNPNSPNLKQTANYLKKDYDVSIKVISHDELQDIIDANYYLNCAKCQIKIPKNCTLCNDCISQLSSSVDDDLNTKFLDYANSSSRFIASVIDIFIIAMVNLLISYLSYGKEIFGSQQLAYSSIAFIIFNIMYKIILETMYGATVGKMIVKSRIVRQNGEPVTLGIVIRRTLFQSLFSILTLGISNLSVITNPKNSGLHDQIAKTAVILSPKVINNFIQPIVNINNTKLISNMKRRKRLRFNNSLLLQAKSKRKLIILALYAIIYFVLIKYIMVNNFIIFLIAIVLSSNYEDFNILSWRKHALSVFLGLWSGGICICISYYMYFPYVFAPLLYIIIGFVIGSSGGIYNGSLYRYKIGVFGGMLGSSIGFIVITAMSHLAHASSNIYDPIACYGIVIFVITILEDLYIRAWFEAESENLQGTRFYIWNDSITIGSSSHSQITLQRDLTILGEHVKLKKIGKQWHLTCVKDDYPVMINNQVVNNGDINSNSTVLIGQTLLRFHDIE